jgi:hypothetical protein
MQSKIPAHYETRIEELKRNAEHYVKQMIKMDDKKLKKHIDLFRIQMEMAYKQGNKEAFELLVEMEWQTIVARVNKLDKKTFFMPGRF